MAGETGATGYGAILRLAFPALGALAAEPLYILVDTAIVGHLGRAQLAALGAAATVLGALAIFNFLQYGATAQVARAGGAGEERDARQVGAQAAWLSLAFGVVLAGAIAAFAGPLVRLVGVEGSSAELGETYLRIVALGVPSAFLALGAQGFLRGVADLRSPLRLLVAGNLLNVVLEVWFVYGLGWGIEGSAWGTALAQSAMGLGFVAVLFRRIAPGDRRPRLEPALRLLRIGKYLLLRTAALMSSFLLAGGVVGRLGDAPLGAFQVTFQLWVFLALVLDAVAIAGQIVVGRELGAGRAEDAYRASARMVRLSVGVGCVFSVGLLALSDVLPRAFTGDAAVLAQCALAWPVFALMQPLNGAVFALDGILIGASDGRFIAGAMVASLWACVAALAAFQALDWGLRGVWLALVVLVAARLATLGVRFLRRRWLVTGWA